MYNYEKLETDWFLKKPIDFEHKQYVLNFFLKNVEENLSSGKIYPFFSLVSLHLCNLGHYEKTGKILKLKKKLFDLDFIISIEDLIEYKLKIKLNDHEIKEISKIVKYSQEKLNQYFTVCKTIWKFAFEATNVELKKDSTEVKDNFLFLYKDIYNKKYKIWKFEYKKIKKQKLLDAILIIDKNLDSSQEIENLFENEDYKNLPIIEGFSTQNLPIENTLLPLFKRKINIIFNNSLLQHTE